MRRPASAPLTAAVMLAAGLLLVGCTPAAAPDPSSSPGASTSPSASSSAAPVALPGCDAIYSAGVIATLESEGREPEGDISEPYQGGWGTLDAGLEALLAAIDERVSCTWVLPASESGSTTSVARLHEATRTAVLDALATAGFAAMPVDGGELWTYRFEDDFITYTEAHVITETLWIGSVYTFGDAQTLTLDAAALLLP